MVRMQYQIEYLKYDKSIDFSNLEIKNHSAFLSPRRAAGKQDSVKELVALIVETFKTNSVLCVLYTVPQLQCSNPMTLLQDDSGAKVYIF